MTGWKTVVFNIIAAIMPVLEVSGVELGLEGNLLAAYAFGITVINLALRFVTKTPVFK